MIIVIIVCGILYLFIIYGVILLYYTYNKDYNDLEQRILNLEKRINKNKEGETMACKKGRGGRKK